MFAMRAATGVYRAPALNWLMALVVNSDNTSFPLISARA